MTDRPLPEMERRARLSLKEVPSQLRAELIEIARTKLPSGAFKDAMAQLKLLPGAALWAEKVAKSVRWLAKIRRNHGDEKFEEVVRKLTAE